MESLHGVVLRQANGPRDFSMMIRGQGAKTTFAVLSEDATGYAVTGGTDDQLKVAGTTGQTYDLILFGN